MFSQSKILVWYKIATEKIVLGEAFNDGEHSLISRWYQIPQEHNFSSNLGYHLSLFDDGGREIGDKSISMLTADEFLMDIKKASI